MDFMCADVRYHHLISALQQLVTHAVLCRKGVALTLVVFLSSREAFGRDSMVALHRNMGRQDRAPGTSHPPRPLQKLLWDFPEAAGGPAGDRPSLTCAVDLGFQQSVVSQKWVLLVSAKGIHCGNGAAMGPPAALVCAHMDRVKVRGPKSF